MNTYLIGRSALCAIHLDDPTVSRMHAELTVSRDGKCFITDRASTDGTFRLAGDGFQPVRQAFVEASDVLRFGDTECRVSDLLVQIQALRRGDDEPDPKTSGLRGSVKRNPQTGAIVDS